MTTTSAPSRRLATPSRVAGAVAQLAALGILGPAVFTVLFTMLGLGLGLLPVFGIGLLFLVALVYVIFGVAWIEAARVDGLYDFRLPARHLRSSGRPGFAGYLRTLWLQAIDPLSWRGIANLAVSTILGWIVVALLSVLASGVVLAFAPLYGQGETVRLARTGIE